MGTPMVAIMKQSCILFLVCLLVDPLVAAVTDPVEVSALLAFKASLKDPDGNLGSWGTSGTDPCALPWQGIFCVQTDYPASLAGSTYAHVTELRLLNLNLGGQLVPELGNFTALKYLDVMWNSMTGSVPATIGSLSNLALLLLNGNQFTGSLPEDLGKLTNMQRIQVDQNRFSGQLPRSFNRLTSIRHFHMNNNSFSGTLPTGLGSLPKLVHVLLDNNNLTGTLPNDLANAPNLLIIQLDNNQFDSSATIPPNYALIPTLLKLSLRNCSLQGIIPNFTTARNLSVLDLSSNHFNGSIPSAPYPVSMTAIDVSYNQLSGPVPDSLGNLQQLQFLDVRNNKLQGDIPANLGTGASFNSSGPIILDFQSNSLQLANNSNLAALQSRGNVQVWLAGNPSACSGPNPAASNPLCNPTDVGAFLGGNNGQGAPANSQCSPCNSPYVLVPSTDANQCRCAEPITVRYRLKSPGFLVFDLYEEAFRIYMASGLNLTEAQVQIGDYQYESGPRIAITVLLFPTGPTFDDLSINTLYNDFANWRIPDSSVFGPYELIQFIPPGGNNSGGGRASGLSGGAIGGIIAGSVLFTGVLAAFLMFWCLRRRGWDPKAAGQRVLRKTGLRSTIKVAGVRTFTFEEMVKATDNFNEKKVLGEGGYGKVYFGTLEDGQKVAVKRAEEGSLQGATEFETEIQLLSRVHHRNLVSLVGYCNDEGEHFQGEQMLVYEFISNGTLRDHLRTTKLSLDVVTRLRIALGSARGIHYLHTQADPPIFHRDIKTTNILLDEKYNAKVADFGLSKLAPTDVDFEGANAGHVSTMVKGTPGYLDPEYFLTHKLTDKSDVYSYGVVLLELITGMPPISQGKNIIREVNTAYSGGQLTQIVDPKMGSYPIETLEPLCRLALACCHSDTDSRPSMAEVLHELEEIWKETPWSDVGSHSYIGDLGDHPDFGSQTARGFSRGFSSSMNYTDTSMSQNSTSDLISHTNINVLPR